MKSYYRIMLGRGSKHANECHKENFIGADFDMDFSFENFLPDNWREFNKKYIPVFLENNPGKSKIAAGLACGALHTVSKGIKQGDIILSPDGSGGYLVGEVSSDYLYAEGKILPHRRKLTWYPNTVERSLMSQELRHSTGSIGTVSNVSKYADEIEFLIKDNSPSKIISTDATIEDPSVFALEKHLEDFLVANWDQTILGKEYDIFEEEGELVGQQFLSDTGPIDILAVSKDQKEILVVELKKGRASDAVVGQIQRYMGYVKDELCEDNQIVKGIVIALEDDLRLRRALSVTNNIEFYRYKVDFKLIK
jgi:restriction system protein